MNTVDRIAGAAGVVKDCSTCAHRCCDGAGILCAMCRWKQRQDRSNNWHPDAAALEAALAVLCPEKPSPPPNDVVIGEVLSYLLPDRGRWVPPLGDGKVLPVDKDWQKKEEEGA